MNLFGAPYDYRFMSSQSIIASGLVKSLVDVVEQAYRLNGGRKVVLMGHSNGGPTLYSFLTSSQSDNSLVTQEWKDKYIAAMIGLSGTPRLPHSLHPSAVYIFSNFYILFILATSHSSLSNDWLAGVQVIS